MNASKYPQQFFMKKPDRKWPSRQIEDTPIWCSVDLRDGNQALQTPMSLAQKLSFFDVLIQTGFKEIEVGFPAASDTEYNFTRRLIGDQLIPDDVVIQVLTQSRKHIIEKTFGAVRGCRKAIIHLYNSTSVIQRDVVFHKSKEEIKALAIEGAKMVKATAKADDSGTEYIFQYSPESFSQTEPDYAIEVINAVLDIWQPTPERKVIINLPNTIEMTPPNVFADQVEYICEHIQNRDSVTISVHTHNDRGCAVAASELSLMAGADRIEGTLFGNGERTGNADIVNLAMNLFMTGIDPKLDLSHIDTLVQAYEESTRLVLSKRHPYAGDLVYTAFSGSHQDAIRKGMERMKEHPDLWAVPYLTIDPVDVGRNYEAIVRINAQSGKGGVSFILEQTYGLYMPKYMQPHFSAIVNKVSDERQQELTAAEIFELFEQTYINIDEPVTLIGYNEMSDDDTVSLSVNLARAGKEYCSVGEGNGLLSALCHAFEKTFHMKMDIAHYSEHSMEYGSKSRAITYIHMKDALGNDFFGCGVSSNVSKSSIKAVISNVNKMIGSADTTGIK